MLQDSRLNEILKLVDQKGAVRVDELAKLFNISESTIRRDLIELSKQNKLIKVHGGATATNYAGNITFDRVDKDYFFRENLEKEKKELIARKAASLIKEGASVYLDASTSVASVIDYLKPVDAYFVTNSPLIAKKLAMKNFKVFVTGGELKLTTDAYTGGFAIEFLNKFNFSIGLFGTNGIHRTANFTTPDPVEASIKRKAMERTYKSYILADSSKFNNVAFVTFANLSEATLITDCIREDYRDILKMIDASKED